MMSLEFNAVWSFWRTNVWYECPRTQKVLRRYGCSDAYLQLYKGYSAAGNSIYACHWEMPELIELVCTCRDLMLSFQSHKQTRINPLVTWIITRRQESIQIDGGTRHQSSCTPSIIGSRPVVESREKGGTTLRDKDEDSDVPLKSRPTSDELEANPLPRLRWKTHSRVKRKVNP